MAVLQKCSVDEEKRSCLEVTMRKEDTGFAPDTEKKQPPVER